MHEQLCCNYKTTSLSCPLYVCTYVFILQQEYNTQNIMPEGQQGPEAPTAARNKNVDTQTVTCGDENTNVIRVIYITDIFQTWN